VSDVSDLLDAAVAGGRVSLARLLTLAERGGPEGAEVARLTHRLAGRAVTVGITGAPGSGKSTLTGALCGVVRAAGERIAVLAIDPSSPFSGGAILGDRVRMSDHALDEGVFIRSMATRGHLGGLAVATPAAIRVLDATGFPTVIVETVGVGQVEVEIAGAADTTVVVVNPGWGDAVQANKAGLMEIADVFVINKADRPGAAETRRDLEQMLMLSAAGSWVPPILETEATTGRGVAELWATIAEHGRHLAVTGELGRRRVERVGEEFRAALLAGLLDRVEQLAGPRRFAELRDQVLRRQLDPLTAVVELLGDLPSGQTVTGTPDTSRRGRAGGGSC